MREPSDLSENHALRLLFRSLADRAFVQASLRDADLLRYVSDLLVDFVRTENLYRLEKGDGQPVVYLVDMFELVSQIPPRERKRFYKQIGDYTLFMLGMFPESSAGPRRGVPDSYYRDAGRKCYLAASELERDAAATVTYRKLASRFERCVLSLNWVKEYTSDSFYQYMLRQFQAM